MSKKIALAKSALGKIGGAEKTTWRLAHAFASHGFDVTLLTSQKPPSPFHTISANLSSSFSFRRLSAFDRFCKEHKKEFPLLFGLDRISSQTHLRASNGVHAAYLSHRSKHETLFKRLSFPLNPLHRTLLAIEKAGFEDPSLRLIIANSQMVKAEILQHYRVDESKIHVVHNGVEIEELKVPFAGWVEGKRAFCERHHLDPTHFYFLFIGNNYQRKGLQPLLEALAKLSRKDVHLLVVGKDKNEAHFQKLSESLGIKNQVHWLGLCRETSTFYQTADALVIPSLYDPFANVTLEALAMGLFVLSTRTNGGHEILQPHTGALLEDFPKALEMALQHPKTLESAENARRSIQHLTYERQLGRIVELTLATL